MQSLFLIFPSRSLQTPTQKIPSASFSAQVPGRRSELTCASKILALTCFPLRINCGSRSIRRLGVECIHKPLETIKGAKVNVSSFVLNAHPACDRGKDVCYVQHPCPHTASPLAKDVCFSILIPTNGTGMQTEIVSRAEMNSSKIIQHSHSPCVTPNFVVSKLDEFVARNPLNGNGGLLKYLRQGEDSLWFVLDRERTLPSLFGATSSL